jgi:membrane protein DedA with SNARE-associated domain
MDPQAAIEFLEQWGYPAFTALLLATGLGSPLPEDLLLLTAGYLISAGMFSWPITLALAFVGVMGSDLLLYTAGTRMRQHAPTRAWVQRLVSAGRPGVARLWIRRYGAMAVFFARLVPGTRYLCFISAGLHGVSLRRFVLFDLLGAAIWIPLLLFVGAQLGEHIGGLDAVLRGIGRTVVWIVLALVVGVTVWKRFLSR